MTPVDPAKLRLGRVEKSIVMHPQCVFTAAGKYVQVKLRTLNVPVVCFQVRRLNMYKTRAIRDKKGKIIHEVRHFAYMV